MKENKLGHFPQVQPKHNYHFLKLELRYPKIDLFWDSFQANTSETGTEKMGNSQYSANGNWLGKQLHKPCAK